MRKWKIVLWFFRPPFFYAAQYQWSGNSLFNRRRRRSPREMHDSWTRSYFSITSITMDWLFSATTIALFYFDEKFSVFLSSFHISLEFTNKVRVAVAYRYVIGDLWVVPRTALLGCHARNADPMFAINWHMRHSPAQWSSDLTWTTKSTHDDVECIRTQLRIIFIANCIHFVIHLLFALFSFFTPISECMTFRYN